MRRLVTPQKQTSWVSCRCLALLLRRRVMSGTVKDRLNPFSGRKGAQTTGEPPKRAITVEEASALCAHDPEQIKRFRRMRLHAEGLVDAEDPAMLFLDLVHVHLTHLHLLSSPSHRATETRRSNTSPRLQHIAALYTSWNQLEALHVQIHSVEDFAAVVHLLAASTGTLRSLSVEVSLPDKEKPQDVFDIDSPNQLSLRQLCVSFDSRTACEVAAAIISAADQVEEIVLNPVGGCLEPEDMQSLVDAVERSAKSLRGFDGVPYTLADHQYEALLNSCKTLSTVSVNLPASTRIMGVGGTEQRVELPPNPSGADYAWFEQNNVDRDPVWESPHWVRAPQ